VKWHDYSDFVIACKGSSLNPTFLMVSSQKRSDCVTTKDIHWAPNASGDVFTGKGVKIIELFPGIQWRRIARK